MKTSTIKKCRNCKQHFKPGGFKKHLRGPCGTYLNANEACKLFKIERTTFWRKIKANGIYGKIQGRETIYNRSELSKIFNVRLLIPVKKIRLMLTGTNFSTSKVFNVVKIEKQEKWLQAMRKYAERAYKEGNYLRYESENVF